MTGNQYREINGLLARFKNGDRASFARLYSMYEQQIYFLCCKLLRERLDDAKSLTAEILCSLYKRMATYSDAVVLEKQLFALTFSRCGAYIIENEPQAYGEYADSESSEGERIDAALAADSDRTANYPGGINVTESMMATVDSIFSQLPLQLRSAALAYYFCGFEYSEAASIERISVAAFKNRLYKAHIRLMTEEHKYCELGENVYGMVIFMAQVLSEMAQSIVTPAQIASSVTSRIGINCMSSAVYDDSPSVIITPPAPRQTANEPTRYASRQSAQPRSSGASPAVKALMAIIAVLIIIGATVIAVLLIQGRLSGGEAGSVAAATTTTAAPIELTTTRPTTQTTTETTTATTTETTTEPTTQTTTETTTQTTTESTAATTQPPVVDEPLQEPAGGENEAVGGDGEGGQ